MASDDPQYGVTSSGFQGKNVIAIQNSLLQEARKQFDNRDLSEGSPHRELLDLNIYELGAQWDALEGVYDAMGLESATGAALDHLLAFAGFYRRPRQGATGEVTFYTAGKQAAGEDLTIPAGTTVTTEATETKPAIPFRTTEVATLKQGNISVSKVPIRALKPWETEVDDAWLGEETNVDIGVIRRIADPLSGVGTVENEYPTGGDGTRDDGTAYDFQAGRDRETDPELKQRYKTSLAQGGNASLAAIRDTVQDVPGVDSTEVVEVIDADTNGFRLTVVGGENQDIADTITATRSAGIESVGSTSVQTTVDGDTYTESFDRGTEIPIYINAELYHDGALPSDASTQIKDSIKRYIGGSETSNGVFYEGTGIGEDVSWLSTVAAALHPLESIYDKATFYMGTSTSPTTETDVTISSSEYATVISDSITLTLTEQPRP